MNDLTSAHRTGCTNLENVVRQQEFAEIATGYRRGAGFDPAILNDRPSLSVHT
jgi:5-methylphenazine-1-carboxylate 1-monooxygenase